MPPLDGAHAPHPNSLLILMFIHRLYTFLRPARVVRELRRTPAEYVLLAAALGVIVLISIVGRA